MGLYWEQEVEDRYYLIYNMRKDGKTYKEIGETFNLSASRARQIYLKVARRTNPKKEPRKIYDREFVELYKFLSLSDMSKKDSNYRLFNYLKKRAINE